MNIGLNIKKMRKEKGLTQKQLAEVIDVSTITIQNYENNRRQPNIETLDKLATALNCTLNDLIPQQQSSIDLAQVSTEDLLNELSRRCK